MKININEEKIAEIILKKISLKEKFCLTRIGDGEIAVLEYKKFPDGANHFYKVHLGRKLPDNLIEEISKNLKFAISHSNIIGIPNEKDKLKNKYWSNAKNIIKIHNKNPDTLYCDMNVHLNLVKNNQLDLILKNIEELVLITSRDVKDKIKEKYPNIKKIIIFKIPGEFAYEDEKKQENYYPDIYNLIIKSIHKMDVRGKLLLLGGGFVGKKLGVEFANCGGVSLDIGSVFDLFVGKITRGPGKGAKKYQAPLL